MDFRIRAGGELAERQARAAMADAAGGSGLVKDYRRLWAILAFSVIDNASR